MLGYMRKLWNRPDWPVWSLVTRDEAGKPNLNICTYVVPVSLKPKRMMVAVYHGTKTLANLEVCPDQTVLLQLLTQSLAPVVRVCGQQSGHIIDKLPRLQKRFMTASDADLPYFCEAAGYMLLVPQTVFSVMGDHTLYTFVVTKHKNLSDKPILTTTMLRDQKYIR
jgi:flavin reductase (DIM6/NTAB) family NADH-FMN oxidoreductase RutF